MSVSTGTLPQRGLFEQRGLGIAQARALAEKFRRRDGVMQQQEVWSASLKRARGVHEEGEVKRAIAEWSDTPRQM